MKEVSGTTGLNGKLLQKAFPFHIAIEKDLSIRQVGRSLSIELVGQPLDQFYRVFGETAPLTFDTICELVDTSVTLLACKQEAVALKGEWLYDHDAGVLIFVGSPKLNNSNDLKKYNIKLTDFAHYDTISDLIFGMKSSEAALNDLREIASALADERDIIHTTLRAIHDAVITTNAKGQIDDLNPMATKLIGYTIKEAVGKPLDDVLRIYDTGNNKPLPSLGLRSKEPIVLAGNTVCKNHNEDVFPVEGAVSPIFSHGRLVHGHIFVFRDVSKQRELEQKLKHQAAHDELTGLANRRTLVADTEKAIVRSRHTGSFLTLMLIELNRFKPVNDTYGHHTGDALLIMVAARLRNRVRGSDTLSRLGGDEFALLLTNIDNRDDIVFVAQQIADNLTAPYNIDGRRIKLGVSIGVSFYPKDASNADDLIKKAGMAMYHAKTTLGIDYFLFTAHLIDISVAKQLLENELHLALEGGLMLYYQPKVSLRTGKILSCEALLRWEHPEKGLIYPEDFIMIAEKSSLILTIGDWVIDRACQQIKSWSGFELEAVPIAVNVSAVQLQDLDFVKKLIAVSRQYMIPPRLLELEFTETVLIQDIENTVNTLSELRDAGFKVSLDDFGTGYSSLSYLQHFPIDALKLDKSFINDLERDENCRLIVKTIIQLAHDLKQVVIAEGVESRQQMSYLKSIGCDEIQGFIISKPIPPMDFLELLRQINSIGDENPLAEWSIADDDGNARPPSVHGRSDSNRQR